MQYASIAVIVLINLPIVLLNIAALLTYPWGSQFFISLVDCLSLSLFMMTLMLCAFKFDNDEIN